MSQAARQLCSQNSSFGGQIVTTPSNYNLETKVLTPSQQTMQSNNISPQITTQENFKSSELSQTMIGNISGILGTIFNLSSKSK